jgi:hypothetical protein
METLRRHRIAAAAVLLAGLGLSLSWASWMKWAEPYVDYGFQLYVPWQMNEGQVLYRDIPFLYGPLSQHFDALLFKLFGTQALTLILFNHFLVVIQAGLIFFVLKEIFDDLSGAVCAGLFLSIFAFAQYNDNGNHNFITPYAHEAVHASVLAWAAIAVFLRFLKSGKTGLLFAAGALTGAVLVTKVETLLALSLALSAGLCGWIACERPDRATIFRTVKIGLLGTAVFPAAFFLLYCRWMPPAQALGSVLSHLWVPLQGSVTSDPVFEWFRGTDDLSRNLALIFSAGAMHGTLLAGFALACAGIHRLGKPEHRSRRIAAFWIASAGAAVACYYGIRWVVFFRPLTVYLPLLSGFLIWTAFRSDSHAEDLRTISGRMVVAVFAWVLTLKVAFKIEIFYYGFVLAMPAALFWVGFVLHGLPRFFSRWFGDCGYLKPACVALAVTCGTWHVNQCLKIYAFKTFPVGRGPDVFYDFTPRKDYREKLLQRTLEKIEELKEPGQSLAVFPAGIILNYWTRMPSPTHLYSYNPTNLSATGRAAAQDRFIRNPPDWIILYDSDASLGRGPRLRFGLDYAQPLMAWIQTHYTPQFQAAPPDRSTYGMVILRRNRTAS